MAETAPDPNPYAPPQAPVGEESATIFWRVDGAGFHDSEQIIMDWISIKRPLEKQTIQYQ